MKVTKEVKKELAGKEVVCSYNRCKKVIDINNEDVVMTIAKKFYCTESCFDAMCYDEAMGYRY